MIIDQVDSTIKSAVSPGELRVVCDMAVGIVGHFSATEHRKKAKKVYAVSTHHKNERRRKILVDASLEILQSFEEQFTKIVDSVSPCWKMGIRKLAIDAVDRVMNYISANEKDEFSVDLITKGVVLGESKRGTFAKQALQSFKLRVRPSNYQVKYKQSNEILITSQIYRNAGIKREYTDAIDYYAPEKM